MNLLLCSVGRRGELIKYFKKSFNPGDRIIATDNKVTAPALYFADKKYLVPRIDDPNYIEIILEICIKEKVQAITTFIDPEIAVLAENRNRFKLIDVEVLAPDKETAKYCFDKYAMYQYLSECGIATTLTYGDMDSFICAYKNEKISFPVFVKPRNGSGSVGARKIDDMDHLMSSVKEDHSLIIQEFMKGLDIDADVYIDTKSHKAVSAFTKRKLETRIGGANITMSFKDDKLFSFIQEIVEKFQFNGPIDMDFFYRDGQYFLSEINPRFGGAYLHAYGAGVDFVSLIQNNINGIENIPSFGNYDDGVVMMMYDSVVIARPEEMNTAYILGENVLTIKQMIKPLL